jgi:hypothetical protein
MSEILIFVLLFLVVSGAMAFYFYSRMLYSERKISLLESVLLDIKMSMEMEQEAKNDHMPTIPPRSASSEPEELKDETDNDAAYYNSVLETVNEDLAATTEAVAEEATEATEATEAMEATGAPSAETTFVEYEAMTRDEVAALAEKRGIRVVKRQAKSNIITLLRESDRNSSGASETGKDVPVGTSSALSTVEGTAGGAPLDIGAVEVLG